MLAAIAIIGWPLLCAGIGFSLGRHHARRGAARFRDIADGRAYDVAIGWRR